MLRRALAILVGLVMGLLVLTALLYIVYLPAPAAVAISLMVAISALLICIWGVFGTHEWYDH